MDLSIIITVYNKEKYIEDCLKSIINQDIENYEIIIVNDGSTDNSDRIIKDTIKKYESSKIITYYKQENKGVSIARNKGLELSTGKYITYIDSDDYAKNDIYAKLLDMAIFNDYDILIYDHIIKDNEAKEYDSYSYYEKRNELLTKNEYILVMPCPWNKLIKREKLIEMNFEFPINMIYEDFASIPAIVTNVDKIYYSDIQAIYYVQSENSIMRNEDFKEKSLDIFKAINVLEKKLTEKNTTEYIEEIEFLYIKHLLLEFGLTFYKYEKYEHIDKISDIIKNKFPKWYKNKYYKKFMKKDYKNKIYMYIFYFKKYRILNILQKMKKLIKK